MISALVFGGSLVVLGVSGYVLTGKASKTALIPAFFGMPVCAAAAVGLSAPGIAPQMGYMAIGIAALGLVGTGGALVSWSKSMLPHANAARAATVSKGLMAIGCLGFLVAQGMA